MTDLLSLAVRVEAAEAREQRALLMEAYETVFGGPECTPINKWPGYSSPRWDRFHMMLDAEAYESAAMTLVPEGWTWTLNHLERSTSAHMLSPGPYPTKARAVAATPALALAAAALRARANEQGDVE